MEVERIFRVYKFGRTPKFFIIVAKVKEGISLCTNSKKKRNFCSMDRYGNYGGDTSSSDGYSLHSTSEIGSTFSEFSTESTYGTLGTWTGGDTHASGYDADVESLASTK